jgi:hypothetical protein
VGVRGCELHLAQDIGQYETSVNTITKLVTYKYGEFLHPLLKDIFSMELHSPACVLSFVIDTSLSNEGAGHTAYYFNKLFFMVRQPKSDLGRLIVQLSTSHTIRHTHTHTHTVGFL